MNVTEVEDAMEDKREEEVRRKVAGEVNDMMEMVGFEGIQEIYTKRRDERRDARRDERRDER